MAICRYFTFGSEYVSEFYVTTIAISYTVFLRTYIVFLQYYGLCMVYNYVCTSELVH